MADMLIKMKTGTIAKMLETQNNQPVVPLEKGSVYFAVDTSTHKGKILYDAPLDPNGVDRIVMSTDAESARKDDSGNVITTTYATKNELSTYVPAGAMIYRGLALTTADVTAVHKAGWTYKIAAAGTYAGKTCEVGDLLICIQDNDVAANASDNDWIVIQTNVDKALYKGTNAFTDEYMLLADGTNGKVKAVNMDPTVTLTGGTSSYSPKFKVTIGGKTSNEVSIGTASTSTYGTTKLSNATDSESQSLAATPYAVKAAYDLAASKTDNVGTITGVVAGGGLTGGGTSGSVTLGHSNSMTAVNSEALYKVKFDAYGHITGAVGQGVTDNSANADVTSSDTNLITGRTLYYQLAKKGYTTNTGTVTSVGTGNGLTGGPVTTTGTISHAVPTGATSGAKGTTGGREYIQQITTDDFGHITGYLTATETVTNTHHQAKAITTNSDTSKTQTTTALTNGNVYLNVIENNTVRSHHKISGTNLIGVTTDTSGNIKIDHTAPTGASAQTYQGSGSRSYVKSITSDAYGHVTGVVTGTETVVNTDTSVNVTLDTTSKAYLLGTTTTPTSTATGTTAVADTGVYLDTTAGKLTAGSFAGSGASLTSLNASNISSGTLNAARLATSGVTAGVYQGLTVDTYGRVTGAIDKDYATKTELNNLIAAADALVYKGTLDGANTSPGAYTPAADCGHVYKVSTGGYINGQKVEAGDMFICTADSTVAATSSNYSTVQATWSIVQTNTDGIVIGPASSNSNTVAIFDGTTGKLIKDSTFTIGKSVPSDAKFTDTTSLSSMTGTLSIAHGGTGKTTAAEAWTALGGGASGKHDDSYFALADHGNHVPATQTANNAVFLRNDNTWQTVSPANIGAAPTSHAHGNLTSDGKVGTAANKAIITTTNGAITAGTVPAAAGGTGKTNLKDSANALINALDTGSSTPVDADYYISQYVSGGTSTTTYHRRPMSALWSYIKGKADSVYATSGHTHTTSLASDTGTSTVTLTSGGKFKLTAGGTSVIFTMPTSNNYSHPTGDGNLHVPATGTTNNGKFLKAGSTAGSISWASLSSSDITTALGFTPYNSTNPNGYTTNVGTITGVTGSDGLTGSGTSGSVTIKHAAPSTSPAKTTSAVYPITIDKYGHITAAGTAVTIPAAVSVKGNAETSYRTGQVNLTPANLGISATTSSVTVGSTTFSKYSHPTYTSKTSGLYKITVDGTGHVSAATAVTKADITGLGIPGSDTDTKVTNTLGTTTKYYVTGTTSATTATGTQTFDTGIYATTTAGELNATQYKVNEAVTLQYNSTTKSLDFIFA